MRQDELRRGIHLFNAEHFFEAHEALEDAWREAPAKDKKFLQGVVQLAVALHHYSTGNVVGSRSVLARALRNVASRPEGVYQLRTTEILETFLPCQRALEEHGSIDPLPKLKLHG
jgi:predicted metal-dependent hydrolase